MNGVFEKYSSYLDVAGRFFIAFIFVRASVRKIMGWKRFQAMMQDDGVAEELLPLVILTEIGCGIALILGWQTRMAAFLLAGFTALASFMFNWNWEADFTQYLLFSKNIAIFGGLIFIVAHGAGRFSVDAHRAGISNQRDS